jgi:hypothetical protein
VFVFIKYIYFSENKKMRISPWQALWSSATGKLPKEAKIWAGRGHYEAATKLGVTGAEAPLPEQGKNPIDMKVASPNSWLRAWWAIRSFCKR